LGINETDDQDVDAFNRGENYNVAPYRPTYMAGYIQDKIEYRDLVVNLGLRVDVFDNNAQVLRDPYAVVPIVRAGDLAGATLPANVGRDWAVYFEGGRADQPVRGYRDLEGRYYDASGQETTLGQMAGRPAPS